MGTRIPGTFIEFGKKFYKIISKISIHKNYVTKRIKDEVGRVQGPGT